MSNFTSLIHQAIREYDLERYPGLDWLTAKARLGRIREHEARLYWRSLEPFINDIEDHPNFLHRPPHPDQFATPDFEVCTLENGVRFGPRILDRPRNILCVGDSGSGKTTLMRNTLHQIEALEGRRSTIVLDIKGDFCDFTGPNWIQTSVHDGLRLGFNAPGVPAQIWIQTVCTIFCALGGLIKAWPSIAKMMLWLVEVLNRSDGSETLFPDIRLLLEVARRSDFSVWAAKADYERSLIQTLEAFNMAAGGFSKTFNGLDIERDIVGPGKNLVIDLRNMNPPELRQFVIHLVISQVLSHRIYHQKKMSATEVVMCIDEADSVISRQAEKLYGVGNCPLSQVLSLGREYGIMMILGARIIANASRFVLNSCPYQFCGNMPDAESIQEAAGMLDLPPRAAGMIPGLSPGQLIVRQSQARWCHAMLADVDYLDPYRGPRPEYVELPNIPSKSLDEMPDVRAEIDRLSANAKAGNAGNQKKIKVEAEAERLLELAADHPWEPVVRLWEMMPKAPSLSRQRTAVSQLENAGLAQFELLQLKRKKARIIRLTDEGWRRLGRKAPEERGKGGSKHLFMSHTVAKWAKRQNLKAIVEWRVPKTSHLADVGVQWPDGSWWDYEVVDTCEINLANHLHACFRETDVVDRMVIVAATQGELDGIRADIETQGDYEGRVEYAPLEQFLEV
jgi:hypothetical protein